MAILFAIAFLVVSSASGAEVSRQRVYHSPYQPGVIVALLVDSAIDTYQAGGIGDGIEIDFDSIDYDIQWQPFRIEYSYDVRAGGVFAHKRTIASAGRVWQSAYVTGDIGELSSAYWTSTAVPATTGTRITNTLSVTWYPTNRCRMIRRLVDRVATNRVIPPLVDNGLYRIERKVRDFAHSGQVWSVIEELQGGLK